MVGGAGGHVEDGGFLRAAAMGAETLGGGIGEETGRIMGLDRMIHEPSRLAVLTILRRTAGAEYLFVRRLTGLSKGNLSNHLAKLEEAGLVGVGKRFEGKKPVTTVNLTEEGQRVIDAYWDEMEKISVESRRQPAKKDASTDETAGGLGVGEAYGGRRAREFSSKARSEVRGGI